MEQKNRISPPADPGRSVSGYRSHERRGLPRRDAIAGRWRGRIGRRGNMMFSLSILIPVLAAILSLCIDVGYLVMVRNELQGTVDAAALAGSGGLIVSPAEARARAKRIAQDNAVNGRSLTLLDSDIELGFWDATNRSFTKLSSAYESYANAVRVKGVLSTARGSPMRLLILPVISPASSIIQMSKSATAAAQRLMADVVVVQDVSGSFTNELAYAKTGDQDLLTSLNTTGTRANFGLVAFTGTAVTVSGFKSLSSNYATLTTAVDSLGVDTWGMPSTNSGTDIAAGIERAQSMFDSFSSTNRSRYMVIVSDGEPSANSSGAHPYASASQLMDLARDDADTAFANNIDVFVVFWDSANNPTAASNLKSLVRGDGAFIHVTDPTKISEAIANVLSRANKIVK